MERNAIRGALACVAYAAEVNEDDDLATILNVVPDYRFSDFLVLVC